MSIKFNPAVSPFLTQNQNNTFNASPAKAAGQEPNVAATNRPDYAVMQTTRGMHFKAAKAIQESVFQQGIQSTSPQTTISKSDSKPLYDPKFTGITSNNNPVNADYAGKKGINGGNLNFVA